jgi:predicted alpha/beta superfamily hydrolase
VLVRIHYPVIAGRLVLRHDSDWAADVEASALTENGQCAEFRLTIDGPFRYFKPVLKLDNALHWARGKNYLVLAHGPATRDVYPTFFDDAGCTVCELQELAESDTSAPYQFRVFVPPGYDENTLKRYPVLYLQDGQNVFFPSASPGGADWQIRETLSVLNDMNAIDKIIAIGIYPRDREQDYTQSGYDTYGQFVAHRLKPHIDATFRTLDGPKDTAVMGASLGGVVSLYLAWHWPDVFGMTACLSSTFGWRDDLQARITTEAARDIRIYLDSGWPQDNFEVTRDMVALLLGRGYEHGRNLLHFAFPGAHHNEAAWAVRSHIPFQFLFGNRQLSTQRHPDIVVE